MRIYDVNVMGTSAADSSRTQETQRAERDGRPATTGTGGARNDAGDHIELSTTLNALGRAMSTYGTDRAAKVQALAAQFRTGNYSVNSLATSQAMISAALSAPGR